MPQYASEKYRVTKEKQNLLLLDIPSKKLITFCIDSIRERNYTSRQLEIVTCYNKTMYHSRGFDFSI